MNLPSLSAADLALVAVVTGLVTAVAYLRSPRAKSLAYSLPLPFTAGLVASGQEIDATHIMGVAMVWGYPWLVWLLCRRVQLNVIAADAAALAAYLGASLLSARLVPAGGSAAGTAAFWAGLAALLAGGLAALTVPCRPEPGHRSPLPAAVKVPGVFLLVAGIVLLKNPLRGFMPTFPFVTVFTVYEARNCLHTIAARMPVFILGMVPFLAVCRLAVPAWGHGPALALAWAAYLPVYLLLDRFMAGRAQAVAPGCEPAPSPQRADGQ